MQNQKNIILDYAELHEQNRCAEELRLYFTEKCEQLPLACVHSYGCQQNVADGERMKGVLAQMGYGFTDSLDQADLILYNTCAVRENAELRVFGNVGALKHYKKRKPGLVIILAGCMTQQQQVALRLKKSYPHVDIVLGTNAWTELPKLLYEKIFNGKRYIHSQTEPESGMIVEGVPVRRDGSLKAWVSVMNGCDNFCSYCIVPYVRGRERSRQPENILAEISDLVQQGYKEIMLLGQNVNSYGKGLEEQINFAQLLYRINQIPGDFRIRFMTSHPKDCTHELIDAIAACRKVCNHIHLPVQSGSDRILERMNRRYTVDRYLELVEYARKKIQEVMLTSDLIVGFPGEEREDFEKTLELVRRVGYASLYTFIYSRRSGTRAEHFDDPIPPEKKSEWFRELLAVQDEQGQRVLDAQIGKTMRVLPETESKDDPGWLNGRSDNNFVVEMKGSRDQIGSFQTVKITGATNWCLTGEILRPKGSE